MSGISVYTCRLANALADIGPTSVITMRKFIPLRFYPGKTRAGAPLARISYDPRARVVDGVDWTPGRGLFRAVGLLLSERPAAVLLEWWTGAVLHNYLLLAVVARAVGASVFVEFHEIQDVGEAGWWVAKKYVSWFFGLLRRLCSGYVVHSQHDRAIIADHYGLEPSRIRVVRHGPYDHLESSTLVRPAPGTDPGHSRPAGVVRLLYFGVIRPYKGLDDLASAFEGLSREEAAGYTLTIVGEVWEGYDQPLRAFRSSAHAGRITIVDRYVDDDELAALLADADALVLPYRRSSASGPLHVAMGLGLPVLVTDVGGLAEAVGAYPGAITVPAEDPHALRDGLLALRVLVGTRYKDSYSWEDSAREIRSFLTERRPTGRRRRSAGRRPSGAGLGRAATGRAHQDDCDPGAGTR